MVKTKSLIGVITRDSNVGIVERLLGKNIENNLRKGRGIIEIK